MTIEVRDLSVELDADAGIVRALDALALTIERGETFALVGESGCGKSMTALALTRLLPDNGRISAGRVTLDGDDLLALPESRMRTVRGGRVGMIFQEPGTSLNPVLRIGTQLVEAIETHTPLRGEAARLRAIEWLGRVGIPEPERRIDEYPFRLSGGQKQRVMIAMALAAEPELLIADEPTTALDVTIQAQILELLRDLQRERRMALLLITHDLAVVSGMAHRVALMYAGQIVEVASAPSFFAAPRHPYARLLMRALPGVAQRGAALAAIGGTVPPLTQVFTGCRFAPRCDRAQPACEAAPPELEAEGERLVRCIRPVPADEREAPRGAVPPPADGRAAAVPLLEVRELRVRFPIRAGLLQRPRGAFTAVDGVSFVVPAGRTVALVGESGCGKTTVGKTILQLLRRLAYVEGEVRLDGQDLNQLDGEALQAARRQVQLVFQDPFASLDPRFRVRELIEEGLIALRPELDAAARRERILRLVEQVGLRPEALGRYPHEFSGGQRQRIAIARALAVEPRLLVCDEPTSALDVSVQAQVLNLLKQLQRDMGLAYLFITHNLGVVEYLADEVVVMRAGRIEEQGSAGDLLQHPRSAYTRTLLDAVPRIVA
jgi:peptide/nickel transport system ATP-binding protein